jgi:hypothetical protein
MFHQVPSYKEYFEVYHIFRHTHISKKASIACFSLYKLSVRGKSKLTHLRLQGAPLFSDDAP